MAVWKILLVLLFALACMALATATLIIPLGLQGSERWLSLAGLLAATVVTGGLFALFLRYAGNSLNDFPKGSRL